MLVSLHFENFLQIKKNSFYLNSYFRHRYVFVIIDKQHYYLPHKNTA